MLSFLGAAPLSGAIVSIVSYELEALFMYGLVALLIGLIAWSKYSEPPLSDPYPQARPGRDLPIPTKPADLGPVVAVPPAHGVSAAEK